MKKLKLFVVLLFFVIAIPHVKAATASTSLAGNNSIKVGETTTIYVRVNTSSSMKGIDLTYSVSGSLSIVSTSAVGGMTVQSSNGNRSMLYSSSALPSGSSVFAITVRGDSAGTGNVSITSLSATVVEDSGYETAYGNSASYAITINANQPSGGNNTPSQTNTNTQKPTTQTNTMSEAEKAKLAAEKKAKEEAEAKAKEEAEAKAKEEEELRKKELSKATLLVEATERSLLSDDYEAALKAVTALADSDDKDELLKRLEEAKFDISVKENCDLNDVEISALSKDSDSLKWIIVNVVLLIVAISEFIYIIITRKKKD